MDFIKGVVNGEMGIMFNLLAPAIVISAATYQTLTLLLFFFGMDSVIFPPKGII